MRPNANLANESLSIAMNVTKNNILKDRWEKAFVVQQFNVCGKKNWKFSAKYSRFLIIVSNDYKSYKSRNWNTN